MKTVKAYPLLATILLLAGTALAQSGGSVSQTVSVDTAKMRPMARNLFGVIYGLGIAYVNPTEDYYLPNDGVKAGSEFALNYTRFFDKKNPYFGLRLGINAISRTGNYTFFGQQVHRSEALLAVPLELVTHLPWREHPRWYSTTAAGIYYGQVFRTTATINPATGKTQTTTDNWLYGVGGITASLAVGHERNYRHRELGVRVSLDLTHPRDPDAGQLPNLRQNNISLYYAVAFGL